MAAGLLSVSGRRLADWLINDGLPDPVSTRVEQRRGRPGRVGRIVVGLDLAASATGAGYRGVAGQWLTRPPDIYWDTGLPISRPTVLAATLPHHREVIAACSLPSFANLAVGDLIKGASLLPLLAESDGPFGPAMSLAVAYTLTAGHPPDRVAATDAFLILAARGEDTAEIGRDLATLSAYDLVRLARAAAPLGDAHRAGASRAVWALLVAALPGLIPHRPRGLPDIFELATEVAVAVDARDEIPGLSGLIGGSRSTAEGRRLHAALTR